MKLAVLFSGGKDSCIALYKARQSHDVACLVTILSENKESYMFHIPNIDLCEMQAEAIGLPIIQKTTKGEKEKELEDLKEALRLAKENFKINGVVTGAIRSSYQSNRIQRICDELALCCFSPLWQRDEIELLNEIVHTGFKAIISGVFAFPLDKSYLGKVIDAEMVEKLKALMNKYALSPAGEGGEIETTVLDAPFFNQRLEVLDYDIAYQDNHGVFNIRKARLAPK